MIRWREDDSCVRLFVRVYAVVNQQVSSLPSPHLPAHSHGFRRPKKIHCLYRGLTHRFTSSQQYSSQSGCNYFPLPRMLSPQISFNANSRLWLLLQNRLFWRFPPVNRSRIPAMGLILTRNSLMLHIWFASRRWGLQKARQFGVQREIRTESRPCQKAQYPHVRNAAYFRSCHQVHPRLWTVYSNRALGSLVEWWPCQGMLWLLRLLSHYLATTKGRQNGQGNRRSSTPQCFRGGTSFTAIPFFPWLIRLAFRSSSFHSTSRLSWSRSFQQSPWTSRHRAQVCTRSGDHAGV